MQNVVWERVEAEEGESPMRGHRDDPIIIGTLSPGPGTVHGREQAPCKYLVNETSHSRVLDNFPNHTGQGNRELEEEWREEIPPGLSLFLLFTVKPG